MQQEITNKSIIRDFYRQAIGQGDLDFARQVIADNYIQHSPSIKPGKAGLLESLTYVKQMPKPATTAAPFLRLIAENDYVVTNMSFNWGDQRKAVIDIFRLKGGQIVEHWDAIQDEPKTTLNGHAMLDGSLPMVEDQWVESNKAAIQQFYQAIFINRQLEKLSHFVAHDLIQHKPEMANGLAGLRHWLQQTCETVFVEKIQLIVAEGDFVFVQANGKLDQKFATLYDIFRLSEGKIIEQWGLKHTTQ